jgi:hypothetical protein
MVTTQCHHPCCLSVVSTEAVVVKAAAATLVSLFDDDAADHDVSSSSLGRQSAFGSKQNCMLWSEQSTIHAELTWIHPLAEQALGDCALLVCPYPHADSKVHAFATNKQKVHREQQLQQQT